MEDFAYSAHLDFEGFYGQISAPTNPGKGIRGKKKKHLYAVHALAGNRKVGNKATETVFGIKLALTKPGPVLLVLDEMMKRVVLKQRLTFTFTQLAFEKAADQ